MTADVRLALSLTALVAVVLLAGLATLHTRHYSQRRLILLENRVIGIERLLTEDRTI